jgi:histone deacetylase 6
VLNFVTGNLRAVKSDVDESLSQWYKDNSRVYVSSDHACWSDPGLTHKVNKRRFGNVIRSEAHGLNKMMHMHAAEAQEWLMDRTTEMAGDTTEDEAGTS